MTYLVPTGPARYLLQARSDFYSDSGVTNDLIYAKLSPFVQDAVAAPNKDFYQEKGLLEKVVRFVMDIVGLRKNAPRYGKKVRHEEL